MRRVLVTALATAAAGLLASPASASLVLNNQIQLSAQGFGAAPRDLTIQGAGTVSGCVSAAGGSFAVGSSACMGTDAAIDPNGVINTGGGEPSPQTDNQKYGVPTEASLGITSAADIGVLFNGTQPGGGPINVTDVTLKFYNMLTGALVGSIDGSANFLNSNPGNGVAGFTFVVDTFETPYVNNLLNTYQIQFALEATTTGNAGGPDTFRLVNLRTGAGGVPEPATWAMMLLGFGGIGIAMRRSRRRNGVLSQIA